MNDGLAKYCGGWPGPIAQLTCDCTFDCKSQGVTLVFRRDQNGYNQPENQQHFLRHLQQTFTTAT